MVVVIDPPVAKPQSTPESRAWQPRPRITRQRDKESVVPESLFATAEFSRKTALSILDRNGLFSGQFRPTTAYEQMLIADMALAQARIDRAAELLVAAGDCGICRTGRFWREDQRTRALNLKVRLARDPARASHALAGFKQGAELTIELWEGLASVLASTDDWDEQQRSLALDLLGVHIELRTANTTRLPAAGDKAGLAGLAAGEIARLTEKIADVLDDRDEDSREEALAGLAPEEDARNKRLKRSEAIARRDHQKALGQLLRVRAEEEEGKPGRAEYTLRAWDVDPLIRRIKNISEPPGVTAEIEAFIEAKRRLAERPAVATAPDASVVTQETPAVAPDTTPMETAALESPVASAAAIQSECACDVESPAAGATASPDDQTASTLAISIAPSARLSRAHARSIRGGCSSQPTGKLAKRPSEIGTNHQGTKSQGRRNTK